MPPFLRANNQNNNNASPNRPLTSPLPDLPTPLRVCVLTSSYAKSDSILRDFEGTVPMSPSYYFPGASGHNLPVWPPTTTATATTESNQGSDAAGTTTPTPVAAALAERPFDGIDDASMTFDFVPLDKATVYATVRQLAKSGKYDVFFNLCDGAKDEDRAGEEVVRALEEFSVPFTGAISEYYEMAKPDMKMIAHYAGVPSAPSAVLEATSDIPAECAHLRFPVIVKHVSGYSSVGMTKDCKCTSMEALVARATAFMEEYQFALVEEFVTGDEVTILACADSSQPSGVRVYHPVMVNFPEGDDFKHFQLKWECFEGMAWRPVPRDDPALAQMIQVTRDAFVEMMGGVGYGRVDLRIDRTTNQAIFLEINPNCGIMYPPGQEGSADWILRMVEGGDAHRDFALLQMREAMRRNHLLRPLFRRCFSEARGFHLKSTRAIPQQATVFMDEGRMFRLHTKNFVQKHWTGRALDYFTESSWPLGADRRIFAVWDVNPANWRSFNHSCDPNLRFDADGSINVVAARNIAPNEELTMDYRTFMPPGEFKPFDCTCGAANCSGRLE